MGRYSPDRDFFGASRRAREVSLARARSPLWNTLPLIPLSWSLLVFQQCEGACSTISGRVATHDGAPVVGALVCGRATLCTETDSEGKFSDSSPAWNATGVLRVGKPGFVSYFVAPARPWRGLHLTISKGANPQWILEPCADAPPEGSKSVGISFRVLVPKDQKVVRLNGVHDFGYEIRVDEGSESAALRFVSGSYLDGFPDRIWLQKHTEAQLVEVYFRAGAGGDPELTGLDVRGTLDDGRRSRILSTIGEIVEYSEIPRRSADRFDELLRSLCFQNNPAKKVR